MSKPKEMLVSRIVSSEQAFGYIPGPNEMLLIYAKEAIDTFLKSYGINAIGEFKIDVSFKPRSK